MEFLKEFTNIENIEIFIGEVSLVILLGFLINYIYRKTYKGIAISTNFANTLTGLTIISYFILMSVTTNPLLSLGALRSIINSKV